MVCPLVVITTNGRFEEVFKEISANVFGEIRKMKNTMKDTFRLKNIGLGLSFVLKKAKLPVYWKLCL